MKKTLSESYINNCFSLILAYPINYSILIDKNTDLSFLDAVKELEKRKAFEKYNFLLEWSAGNWSVVKVKKN